VTRVTPILNQFREYMQCGVVERVRVMSGSPRQARLLFGFDAAEWLFLVAGVALTTVVAAVFVF